MPQSIRIIAALIFCAVSLNAAEGWLTDFDEALAKGRKESKPLFVFFNDTSSYGDVCRRFNDKVLSSAEFRREASKYVLVRIDMDMKDAPTVEGRTKNSKIAARYEILGHPCVVLVDSESGDSYGMIAGGGGLGARHYMAQVAAYKNSESGRAAARDELNKSKAAQSKSEQFALGMLEKMDAAIARKDLRLAERLYDEMHTGGVPKNSPFYWMGRADIVLKVDPNAKAQAAKYFDLAAKGAQKDPGILAEIAKRRAQAGL